MFGECIFGLIKVIYILLTLLIILFHSLYLYGYIDNIRDFKSLFSHNHFAQFMGIFLGLLFRVSGFLSACKEKIALTVTYSLFLLLILLLTPTIDLIFAIHVITAIYALFYALILKYRRHRQRRRLLRHMASNSSNSPLTNGGNNGSQTNRGYRSSSSSSASNSSRPSGGYPRHISVDLLPGPEARQTNISPTAPPLMDPINGAAATVTGGFYPHLPPSPGHQHYTPPPSYTELFEQAKQPP